MNPQAAFASVSTQPAELPRFHDAGLAAVSWTREALPAKFRRLPSRRALLRSITAEARKAGEEAVLRVVENARLIRSAAEGVDELNHCLRHCPAVQGPFGVKIPRVCAVARDYLRLTGGSFDELEFTHFLEGYQEAADLTTVEIEHLKPALSFVILERLAMTPVNAWDDLLTTLRNVENSAWGEVAESVSPVDRVLKCDPAGAYDSMDADSRATYRRAVTRLAQRSGRTERDVAEKAVELSEAAARAGQPARRRHAGYYLVDRGLTELRAAVRYRPTLSDRFCGMMSANPVLYPAGIEALTLIIVAVLVGPFAPVLGAILCLLVPASQAAVDLMNHFMALMVRPRTLPKLDFSNGIPDDCATIVAVPALLLNEEQTRKLVLDLEIRYLANRDRNLSFGLLTDAADSDSPDDDREPLADLCCGLIEELNRKYRPLGHAPFYVFHRNRIFNPSEGRWIGWERKRGKLIEFNRLLRGASNGFSLTAGDLTALPRVRYVITLDADTQLPRDAAARLVGAIAHPLNRAVIDPVKRTVVEGYGILQPRIGISVKSAARSRLAALYSGATGLDIYTRAISEVYQDMFGEGIYTGKGIYDVDALRETLEDRFPENALLSHDLIEGAYARAALVSDIELIDDYPSHFSAYSRRKHRWVRGDWQILRWVGTRVPDGRRRRIVNPIGVLSQWKIVDNLRRSVIDPALFLLMLGGWLWLPGPHWYWTVAAVAILLMPTLADPWFSLSRVPADWRHFKQWARDAADRLGTAVFRAFLTLVFLLHQTLLSVDAIVRSVLRVAVTKRKLLEWETAAEAEGAAGRKSTVDKYLEITPWLSVAIGLLVWRIRPGALPVALPILGLWFASRSISAWLNRAPRAVNRELEADNRRLLVEASQRMCLFFEKWSSPATNWMIPDSVNEEEKADLRISPTNLGLLLNTRIAAVHLGTLPLEDFVTRTRSTLAEAERLEKYRGHLLNWYDIKSREPISPKFVSTVDSGNLAACLWTLKQAALGFAVEPESKRGVTPALAAELEQIAEDCECWIRQMDFRFLYQPVRRALSIGYSLEEGRLSAACYDLLASEARIAAFVAIAKGDVPQEVWLNLGRSHTATHGQRVLVSWTGTMFEYLMPLIWMEHPLRTIAERSAVTAVRAQREFAASKGMPWGISECAFCDGQANGYGYAAFGVPEMALKRIEEEQTVISPYSTFLALAVDPAGALANLRREEELGWLGRYGFYEAVDFRRGGGGETVRTWMAHHQGMSLLAACNLLADDVIRRTFHAEPQVMATELLLEERVPGTNVSDVGRQNAPLEEALEALAK